MLRTQLRIVKNALRLIGLVVLLSGFIVGPSSAEWIKVRQVIDGDTIVLENDQHVRLIGVDTPEVQSKYNHHTEYYAVEAKEFVERHVKGQSVFLEGDDGQAPLDKYGRRLAYVYLKDHTLLNREIVEQGYGQAIYGFPYKFKNEFLNLEEQARQKGLGMWRTSGGGDK